MTTRVIRARTAPQAADAAREGARVLEAGGLVAFATETVYGLAAVASNAATMDRLRELKDRPSRPFSVHIGRAEDVKRYVQQVPAPAHRLITRAWPGPVTILLPVGGKLADASLNRRGLYDVLVSQDMIGLRFPDELVASMMLEAVADPVVAPSANLAGAASPRSAQDVLDSLDGKIDLVIDSGPAKLGKDSTIVSFGPSGKASDWTIVRAGAVDERMVRRFLRQRVLLVCTGNTCRSPMAAGLLRKLLAEREGCEIADLKKLGLEVNSAGLMAGDGMRATPEAVEAAAEHGADISRHHSRMLTSELIREADLVLCMTEFHVAQAQKLAPSEAGRICRLDSRGDIPDPIGAGSGVYRRTAQRMERILKELVDKGTL